MPSNPPPKSKTTPQSAQALLKVREAARILRVSRGIVRRLMEEGRLEFTKMGPKAYRVHAKSVRQYMHLDADFDLRKLL